MHAFRLLLPAATTTVTPAVVAASMASFQPWLMPLPPKLRLATMGRMELVANQSSAAQLQELPPPPESLNTLTLRIVAAGATP